MGLPCIFEISLPLHKVKFVSKKVEVCGYFATIASNLSDLSVKTY